MPLDPGCKGRSYGPYVYEAAYEKIREFALAIGGGVPSASFSATLVPADLPRIYHDRDFARSTPHCDVVAPPTFAVTFNLRPFAAACHDPRNGVNLLMLVHGEQEYEFLQPIQPGHVLTTTGTITSAFDKAGMDFLTVVSESTNQRGQLAVRGTYTAVIRR